MKKLHKLLLPTMSAAALLTPLTLTSCAKVYEDVNVPDDQYNPDKDGKYDGKRPTKDDSYTEDEATELYFSVLKNDIKLLSKDLYWSSNKAANHPEALGYDVEKQDFHFTKYLINISDCSYKNKDGKHYLSFKVNAQIESKYNQVVEGKKVNSYETNSYIYDYSFSNIEYKITTASWYKDEPKNEQWYLKPVKYHPEGIPDREGYFWEDLIGDERITYNIRQVTKGFSENGVQNFSYEYSKAAIMSDKHKYTPALDNDLTSFLLNWCWYLSDSNKKGE